MKLVWSPETALKAYIDTVKSCEIFRESSVAELISAMAAGWNAKLIVETWSKGGVITTSMGLAVARAHTGGRHVCIVPDEDSKNEYIQAIGNLGVSTEILVGKPEEAVKQLIDIESTEILVGKPEEAVKQLIDIDFLVVDSKINDLATMLRDAKLGHRGAVLVCKNASSTSSEFRWRSVVDGGSRRVVRSVFLPVGKGLDIAHVAAIGSSSSKGKRRWYKSIDRETGEEYVIRK